MAIKSKSELIKMMDDIAKAGLIKLANEVKSTWKHYIQTKFYDEYQPTKYNRTYDLLNSVVTTNIYKSGGAWKIDIYMDDSDVFYKNDDSKYIFNLSSQGIHGLPQERSDGSVNPFFVQTEGRFYESILDDLNNGVFEKEFSKILSEMGLKLTKKYS